MIRTKRELEQSPEGLRVLLDDGAPRENVGRFARNRGFGVTEAADGFGWVLVLTPAGTATAPAAAVQSGERVLLITADQMGAGPEELGRLLMRSFIHALLETPRQPDRILLLNSGVLLAVEGAETVEALRKLGEQGVEIFACGLCLDYFGKKEQLAAGSVTNMFSTAETLLAASSVIRL
ncbi:sulfurtransferase-like selenium metabolism protein YedF [Trichlorobacter ammonificans]|uniref:sulfurtransferase-like selenium metabolism protein YedF n=1 Tax=Trichlorobacter ammonificans TaxID=2916410 RepID=UPI002868E3C4|nr:sulfurtransferase-like selenium metabolism protein YedF [Trichlorobacter ammonificans]